jgi:hypothetical protein
MKPRSRALLSFGVGLLLVLALVGLAGLAAAQEPPGRVQRITGRLDAGETHAYLLRELRAGDRLAVSMRATSGNLDPVIGVLDTATPLQEILTRFRADALRAVAESEDPALALDELRDRISLAWDDDGGPGYAAALEWTVPAAGDYVLTAGSSLSALGRTTAGDYELLIGLNAPGPLDAKSAPAGAPTAAPIAERIPGAWGAAASVEEARGTLTAAAPKASLKLADLSVGDAFSARVEAVSGNLIPTLVLRDFGGKGLQAGKRGGQEPFATLEYTATEDVTGYTLDVQAAALPDGSGSEGEYRLLVGVNAPEVLTGQAQPQGEKVLDGPIAVQTGLKILRISAVDSPNENYTILGSLRMDWTDPKLAFSPDTCNCSVKLYSEKEFDRFLADVGSRWPAITFFNQLGNRWFQSRTAAIWPDGRARYAESFNTTFQADFDFRQYPFDTQTFPVFLDLLYPTSMYTMTVLPGYSEIDPAHGEDEFIISDLTAEASTVTPSAADAPVSRMTFAFSAPRHLNYYSLQVFLPIILIILISWFTFFLRDYTRRIEAAAANILLFIAFSWSLADNYPRLGYITFLDAVMAVTFAVNVLVLLYNVFMKRLESQGKDERVQRIDHVLDWAYPLSYAALIGVVVLLFF